MSFLRSAIIGLVSVTFLLPANAEAPLSSVHTRSTGLQKQLEVLAEHARPGVFGITVVDLRSGATYGVNADEPFPMMSVFKAPVAAAVLSRVDAGSFTLEQQVTVSRAEVDPGSAVPSIGDRFQGERMTFTVAQLLTAAVSQSDNTAVDALIKLVGGPASVTGFLREHGIKGMRIDEDEAGVARVFHHHGNATEPPPNETPEQEHERLRRGYQAFQGDPRNRSTPNGAALFLGKLWGKQLLSPQSTQYLLSLMYAQTTPHRLRDGLPAGVRLADKTGSGNSLDGMISAYNDIGLLTWPDGHTVVVAGFLRDSTANQAERDALFANLARVTTAALGNRAR